MTEFFSGMAFTLGVMAAYLGAVLGIVKLISMMTGDSGLWF